MAVKLAQNKGQRRDGMGRGLPHIKKKRGRAHPQKTPRAPKTTGPRRSIYPIKSLGQRQSRGRWTTTKLGAQKKRDKACWPSDERVEEEKGKKKSNAAHLNNVQKKQGGKKRKTSNISITCKGKHGPKSRLNQDSIPEC